MQLIEEDIRFCIRLSNNNDELIDGFELLLIKYNQILHPNHYLRVDIKEYLIKLYEVRARHAKHVQLIVMKSLERQLELCNDILRLLNVFLPGMNRSRAMLIYKIYTSYIALIKLRSSANYDTQIAYSNILIDECLPVLRWEDVTSTEHAIADAVNCVRNYI